MSIDVMKQVLEALETIADEVFSPYDNQLGNAILALRLAIEQAEKQEPVAWMVYTLDGQSVCVTDNPADFTADHRALPLYTAPPQRQPLTDGEIREIAKGYALGLAFPYDGPTTPEMFARAIERKHGIGGSNA